MLTITPAASQLKTVIVTDAANNQYDYFVKVLHIMSLDYYGPGKVNVLLNTNQSQFPLFSFASNETIEWKDTFIYGNLISFIIPPNGNLSIDCRSVDDAQV